MKSRTALVIGNARYEADVGSMRNSGNDARIVVRTLRELGFVVIERHDVTRDQLFKAVMAFRATMTGAEVGLFYYAGHGISVAGANYLIPIKSGYDPDGADAVTQRMLAETRLFNVEQAVAEMKAAGARCKLLILDACRTTALARNTPTRDVTTRGGLSEMAPPAGSLIAFAATAPTLQPYNRGRAYLALGRPGETRADFKAAIDPRFINPPLESSLSRR